MNQLGTMYATKRRRRNAKSVKPQPKDGLTKSNPSKRHRERLNSELDTLAALLPFEQSILSKLDKLSILRLSVSYLRTKSYFQVAVHNALNERKDHHGSKARELLYQEHLLEGDQVLQALNGFVLILNCEGEVFFSSHTVENYLGFHQSDIVHQSVYELVHSEDREELQRQLMWNSHLPSDKSNINITEVILPENAHLLERSFTVRFRCLLDNTSGFLRLDIRGRIKVLFGQNKKTEEPPLALFAVCSPFGPPSLLDMPQKDVMFKSKHKLDLSLVSMDQRGKTLLGYTDGDVANKSGYDLVHYDDIAYVAQAHQELLKTGASGLIAYRLACKNKKWQWLQTSTRMLYKNSKPDFIICTHRPLVEEEGRDLLGKRTMDFKVGFLDAALNISDRTCGSTDNDLNMRSPNSNVVGGNSSVTPLQPQSVNRRYKSPQIRDILSTCKVKRPKVSTDHHHHNNNNNNNHTHHYVEDNSVANYNSVYTGYPTSASAPTENGIGTYTTFQPNFYPTIDNSRFLTTAENFLHYRHHLSSYYPDYTAHTAPYTGSGLLDVTPAAVAPRSCFTTPNYTENLQMPKDERLYQCQLEASKYNRNADCSSRLVQPVAGKVACCDDYTSNIATAIDPPVREGFFSGNSINLQPMLPPFDKDVKLSDQSMCTSSLQLSNDQMKLKQVDGLCPSVEDKMKNECVRESSEPSNSLIHTGDSRDSVLMWGNALDREDYLSTTCSKAVKVDSLETNEQRENKSNVDNANDETCCKWVVVSGATASSTCPEDISSSPHSSTSSQTHTPSSSAINVTSNGKITFCSEAPIYSSTTISDNPSEIPISRVEHHHEVSPSSRRINNPNSIERPTGGNPLLTITEVTNTLLGHQT